MKRISRQTLAHYFWLVNEKTMRITEHTVVVIQSQWKSMQKQWKLIDMQENNHKTKEKQKKTIKQITQNLMFHTNLSTSFLMLHNLQNQRKSIENTWKSSRNQW